jgi:hypothetical protein
MLESRNCTTLRIQSIIIGFLHLIGNTVDIRDRKTGKLASIGVFCMVALICATLTQCAHTCALPTVASGNSCELNARVPNGPCMACLMGQAVATPTLSLLVVSLIARSTAPDRTSFPVVSAWHGFVVSVRPPPLT